MAVQFPTLAQSNQYPEEIVAQYINGCVESGSAAGLDPEIAQSICSCTITQFQSQYTLEEFAQLGQQANAGEPEARQSLTAVALQCAEGLLNN